MCKCTQIPLLGVPKLFNKPFINTFLFFPCSDCFHFRTHKSMKVQDAQLNESARTNENDIIHKNGTTHGSGITHEKCHNSCLWGFKEPQPLHSMQGSSESPAGI